MQIRVLIVSDVRLYREGLVALLQQRPGIEVAGVARTHLEARSAFAVSEPDLVLIDIATRHSIEVIGKLMSEWSGLKVLALAVADSDSDIVACAKIGVCGFVTRESSVKELVAAIQAAVRDELHCSPKTTAALFRHVGMLAAGVQAGTALDDISAREQSVLSRLERGLPNKQIARELGIEVSTVKNHVHRILKKLNVNSRGEAGAVFRREIPVAEVSRATPPAEP